MLNAAKHGPMGLFQLGQPVTVPVSGVDICAWAEQFSQGQRKRAGASPQVRERGAWKKARRAEKIDVIVMVHRENVTMTKLPGFANSLLNCVTIWAFLRHGGELFK